MVDRVTGLTALVLGAAAGGGFPQWNCGCRQCGLARAGDPRARPATQASVALSGNGCDWVVVGASPDLRQQISQTPCLWPIGGARHSPITAAVLIGGDVDAIAGLLVLRERQTLTVYAPRPVLDLLEINRIFDVLDPSVVRRVAVAPLEPVTVWRRSHADDPDSARKDSVVSRGSRRQPAGTRTELCRPVTGARPQRDRRTGLCRHHRPGAAAASPGRRAVLRRHAVHRRRDDRGGAGTEDREADGTCAGERTGRNAWKGLPTCRAAAFCCTSTTPTRSCCRTRRSDGRSRRPDSKSPMTEWRCGCERRADAD